jgi:hypothetical protein
VDIDIEDFRQHFEVLSDATLLSTNRDDLVEAAQTVYDQEIARRGLDKPAVADHAEHASEADDAAPVEAEQTTEALVSVGSFTIIDEARLARGLLHDAGIPCGLATDKAALGILELMVPASHMEAALEVLGGEISEEELAAQAEAAGGWEENGED